jgi:hypothetical protein
MFKYGFDAGKRKSLETLKNRKEVVPAPKKSNLVSISFN